MGLAINLFLEIEAQVSESMRLEASGRNAEAVGTMRDHLILDTYRELAPHGPALHLQLRNGIPLGMGCGSSAAALLAGVVLANHFGELGMISDQILDEACRREGHPDNVAACFSGGFTVSSIEPDGRVRAASFPDQPDGLRLWLALPAESLSTTIARSLLPETYSRADAVANVQATALLVSAFALGRIDLLQAGTRDRLHQPYRENACPLLARLLPLAESSGIHSVTLSGAGPSVLLMTSEQVSADVLRTLVLNAAGADEPELIEVQMAPGMSIAHAYVRQVT